MIDFDHLPYRVCIVTTEQQTHCEDSQACLWCYENTDGAWEVQINSMSGDPSGWLVDYYFEFEEDAAIFKLRWFK